MSGDSDSSGHSAAYSAYAGRGEPAPVQAKPRRKPEWDDGHINYNVRFGMHLRNPFTACMFHTFIHLRTQLFHFNCILQAQQARRKREREVIEKRRLHANARIMNTREGVKGALIQGLDRCCSNQAYAHTCTIWESMFADCKPLIRYVGAGPFSRHAHAHRHASLKCLEKYRDFAYTEISFANSCGYLRGLMSSLDSL
jgi:hypothetical protein